MASLTKTETGWRARVRRGRRSESKTFKTKRQAETWAAQIEGEVFGEQAGDLPRRTVREAFERYRAEVSPSKRGARWESIRIEKIVREWGCADKLLADLTTADIATWRDARLKEVAPSSAARELTIIKTVLETCRREWQWLRANPAGDVRRPPSPKHRTRRPSADEIARLCAAAGYADDQQPVAELVQEAALAFLLACETAMRAGEILSLDRGQTDLVRRVAHLTKTKNGDSRDVPLSLRAVELLRKLTGGSDERLFRLSSQSLDVLFRRIRDRAAIEDLHFHDSRREGTSRLSRKVDVLTLAKITGHRDIKMLLVYYETCMADVALLLD